MFKRRLELEPPADLDAEALPLWHAIVDPLGGRLRRHHALEVELAALLLARIRADAERAKADDMRALGAILSGIRRGL
jgi:hypothetical protein